MQQHTWVQRISTCKSNQTDRYDKWDDVGDLAAVLWRLRNTRCDEEDTGVVSTEEEEGEEEEEEHSSKLLCEVDLFC